MRPALPFAGIALAALALPAQFAITTPAQAAETFHACTGFVDSVPTTITKQGTWCLRKDVSTSITSGAAINIAANNVTLDCNDFKVGGLGAGINTNTSGIVTSNTLNATVRNCSIRGFRTGIRLQQAPAALVQDNRLDQNTYQGISVSGEGSLVQRNRVNDTGSGPAAITSVMGIEVSYSSTVDDNFVQNVVASNGANVSVFGMRVVGGSGSSVSGNIVRNLVANGTGTAYGIYTSNGVKVFITGNRVAATNSTGIGIRCNSGNGSAKDNVSWGFADGIDSSCHDDGGNASH
jgi:hypothetical protein